MGTETKHMSLSKLLNDYNQIIIPDVQRDYVMGSGGEKLIKLLTAMAESNEKNEDFNFSCLVGYEDKDNNLYIYDGQQRLATLVCLCFYLNNDTEIQNLLKKFSFTKREVANDWLSNPTKIKENIAVDFTTYSLAQLIKEFNTQQIRINYSTYKLSDKITFKFLFEKIFFDMVPVNEISDAEQFFLDINDGLDLKSYEIYKAELYHHSVEILKETFKEFALKMENEWLKFFLPYKYYEKKWVNNEYKEVVTDEEEMLVFFLKYCFRMMWIEEKGNDDEFESSDINWLKKEHFERVEKIINAVIKVTKDVLVPKVSCINYSANMSKGQHWNITDTNYDSMLNIFLKNVYNTEETNKDVVIWCYISRLSEVIQDKTDLYNYLRLVKKLLNNSRNEYDTAVINFIGWGVDAKNIIYARYYVQGIPQYYSTGDVDKKYDKDFLNSIINMNGSIELNNSNYLDVDIKNNESLRELIKKEKLKKNSSDCKNIIWYEDLPFINGLVDNLIDYENGEYQLKEWVNNIHLDQINIQKYQYKDILKYIYENKIYTDNSIISNVNISWTNYSGKKKHYANGSLIVHTWCDLFTNEKGIRFSKECCLDYLPILPEGWIDNEGAVIQPQDDIYTENGIGFAAYGKKIEVFKIKNFYDNFSWIRKIKKGGKYEINGKYGNDLPKYLDGYNGKNYIDNNLNNEEKVYFSEKEYLNRILLYRYKKNLQNSSESLDKYNENWMYFKTMDDKKMFIKWSKN